MPQLSCAPAVIQDNTLRLRRRLAQAARWAISSIGRVDELQQLSRGYLSGFNWLDRVRKLHGMHGGKLLRHDRSCRRDWRMRRGYVLCRVFNGLFKLRNRYLQFRVRVVEMFQL